MRLCIQSICFILMTTSFESLILAQKKESPKAQEKKERKAQEKIEKELRSQHLNKPAIDYFPGNTDLAGQCISTATTMAGFQFIGFEQSNQVFGMETPKAAIFGVNLSWSENAAFRFNIGLFGMRAISEPIKIIAFVLNETAIKSVAIQGKIGISVLTTRGWYFSDLTGTEENRKILDSIILSAKSMAQNLSNQQKSTNLTFQQQYDKIKIGMTLEEATEILGAGKTLSVTENDTSKITELQWNSGEGRVLMIFDNDKLIKKSYSIVSEK